MKSKIHRISCACLCLVILHSFNLVKAQVPVGIIETAETETLYRGIDNKIKVTLVNQHVDSVIVRGVNVQITHIKDSEFSVRPGAGRIAYIVVETHLNDSIIEIGRKSYHVVRLPDPILYWGDVMESSYKNSDQRVLKAAYPEDFPVHADFEVVRWVLYCKNERISGTGNLLDTADEFLNKLESQDILTIEAIALGPDGVQRRISGLWKIK